MAPELFQKRQYDEKVDIFAFGTLLFECFFREIPYDGLEAADISSKVVKGENLRIPYGTDARLGQIINDCRNVQSDKRPTFEKIVNILDSFL
jgi:serine/threonine protein kinase